RRNSERHEHILGRLSAAFAEREIVFARAALVAVALDRHCNVWIAAEPFGLSGQDLTRFRADVRTVKGEEDAVAGTRLQILLRPRHDVPRADAAGATGSARRSRWRRFRRRAAAGSEQQQSTQQTDYFRMHLNPPRPLSDNIATSFNEARETKPGRTHPLGWLPRVDWNRSSRSKRGEGSRRAHANRMAIGGNTSAPCRSAPKSVLRPENHVSAAVPPNHPAA